MKDPDSVTWGDAFALVYAMSEVDDGSLLEVNAIVTDLLADFAVDDAQRALICRLAVLANQLRAALQRQSPLGIDILREIAPQFADVTH